MHSSLKIYVHFDPFNKYCNKAEITKSDTQLYQQTHLFMESEKNFMYVYAADI